MNLCGRSRKLHKPSWTSHNQKRGITCEKAAKHTAQALQTLADFRFFFALLIRRSQVRALAGAPLTQQHKPFVRNALQNLARLPELHHLVQSRHDAPISHLSRSCDACEKVAKEEKQMTAGGDAAMNLGREATVRHNSAAFHIDHVDVNA